MIFNREFNNSKAQNHEICPMSFTDKYEKDEYYLSPEGFIVFTEKYHLKRGYCCQNNCRHCPWKKKSHFNKSNPEKGENQ